MGRHEHKIPDVLIPEGDICVPLFIPNHPDYVKLMVRQLRQLILDRKYERDEAHSAIIVRQQWFERMYQPFIDALFNELDCGSGTLQESGDCYGYPLYAPFISYSPMNPYTNPGEVPPDWLSPPFTIYDGGGSLPPAYQAGDIIVPYSSFTLDPFDVFGGQLPTIVISVVGDGQVELDLLAMGQGGRIIVSQNGAPSVLDIIGGIFTPETNVIECELDTSSLPQEDDAVIEHELDIVAGVGVQTDIYLTFVPVFDIDFTPLKFGGGVRGIQLCGFETGAVNMGITDIRVNGCDIEAFENGAWVVKGNILSCVQGVTNPMQNQINTNTNNIASNLTLINANATNINNLTNRVTTNELNIANNTNEIQNNANEIAAHLLILQGHGTTLNDHEARITALENASGGGGATILKSTATKVDNLASRFIIVAGSGWLDTGIKIDLDVQPNAVTQVVFQLVMLQGDANVQESFDARVNAGGVFGDKVRIMYTLPVINDELSVQIEGLFEDLPAGLTSFTLEAQRIGGDQNPNITTFPYTITAWSIGGQSTPEPLGIVTFDAGGYSQYTLGGNPNPFVETANGNPGNCAERANMSNDEYAEITINLQSQQTINNLVLDYYQSVEGSNADYELYVDGQLESLWSNPSHNTGAWHSFDVDSDIPGTFPLVGTTITFRVQAGTSGITILRLDNLDVQVAP